MQSVRNQIGLVRWGKIHIGGFHGAVAVLVVLLSILLPKALEYGPKICPLNHLVGIPCPFCGLTRSFLEIGQFNLVEAVKYHILGIPLFAAFLILPVLLMVRPRIAIPVSGPGIIIVVSIIALAWVAKVLVVSPEYW